MIGTSKEKPTNKTLIKAKRGDIESFEMLVYAYERLLFSIAYRMLGNRFDAEDVVQEAFVKIYQNLESCYHIDVFKAWASTIVTRLSIDELRRRNAKKELSLDAFIETEDGQINREFPSDEARPQEELIQKESLENIEKALLMLSEEQREVVVLRDVVGLPYEEIAENMGIKIGTVKSRLYRGREKLIDILSEN